MRGIHRSLADPLYTQKAGKLGLMLCLTLVETNDSMNRPVYCDLRRHDVILTTWLMYNYTGGVSACATPTAQLLSLNIDWFRGWSDTEQTTSHYLNQWWPGYRRLYASLPFNESRGKYIPNQAPGNLKKILIIKGANRIHQSAFLCIAGDGVRKTVDRLMSINPLIFYVCNKSSVTSH